MKRKKYLRNIVVSLLLIMSAFALVSCSVRDDGGGNSSGTSHESLHEDSQESSQEGNTDSDMNTGDTEVGETTSHTQKNGFTVCIDAGHQKKGISEKEPNGPGSSVMKAKLTSGTSGVYTRIPEYELTLAVSLKLKDELILRGYDVVMIRENNDCPKSNAERAIIANESGSDIFVRIHANGSTNSSVSGALTCAPTYQNEYLEFDMVRDSRKLSQDVIDALCKSTGAKNRGIYDTDTMTGINWCKIPVTIVEMGYMSNVEEDKLMATDEYRDKIVCGIADGIDTYFKISK